MSIKPIDKEVSIQGEYMLKGTLTLPEGASKVPVVLFIHGSGEVDRNENAPKLPMNIFKDLSEEISKMGFATLRYDKRGCGESGGVYLETGFWDLVNDAESAVKFLKSQEQIDPERIILIGHSEGCSIAPAVIEREKIQGMVLIAGFRGSVFDSTRYQLEIGKKEIVEMKGFKGALLRLLTASGEALSKQNDKLTEIIMASKEPVIKIKGRKLNAKWMREHKLHNVDDSLRKIDCPLLALVGSKDAQVIPEQTKTMGEIVNCPFEYHIIEGMNHILRKQSEPITMLNLIKLYKTMLGKPIEPQLISIMKNWLKQFL